MLEQVAKEFERSEVGKKVLKAHKIPFEYGTLAAIIINRAGTDACPMEKAVVNTGDAEAANLLIKN